MRRYRKPQKFRDPGRIELQLRRAASSPAWKFMRTVIFPCLILYIAYSQVWGREERRDDITSTLVSIQYSAEHLPQFLLHGLEVNGLSERLENEVRKAIDIEFPVSVFHLDEETLREDLSGLPEISHFKITANGGENLIIDASPAIPAAVWRVNGKYKLIDTAGRSFADVFHPSEEPDLPLVFGKGADKAARDIPHLAKLSKPINEKIHAFIRVGERRWDVMLKNGLLIMLPANDPISSLEKVMTWENTHSITSRRLTRIDLRVPGDPLFRVLPEEDAYLYTSGAL